MYRHLFMKTKQTADFNNWALSFLNDLSESRADDLFT